MPPLRRKLAAEAKAAADKRAADLAKAAEPKNVNIFETSTSTFCGSRMPADT